LKGIVLGPDPAVIFPSPALNFADHFFIL